MLDYFFISVTLVNDWLEELNFASRNHFTTNTTLKLRSLARIHTARDDNQFPHTGHNETRIYKDSFTPDTMLLKSSSEDFIVEEILDTTTILDESGSYSLYTLKKRQWNTEDCIQWLMRGFNKERRDFAVCGNKDKHAITTQYLTIRHGPKEVRTPNEGEKFFTLEYLGRTKEPLRLGAHSKNKFIITVRALGPAWEGKTLTRKPIRNTFGEQRFSEQNDTVGMMLVRKQYKEAARALGLDPGNEPVAALRAIPKHTRILYVHAAQSRIWNELAATIMPPTDGSNPLIPMPGYGPEGDAQYLPAMDALLEKQGLDRMSFVNRSMPELSVEGNARKLFQDVEEFSATPIVDGTCTLSFTLGTGQYATETVRQLFDN